MLYFPPYLTSAFALPWETRNPEIASFHLDATSPEDTKDIKNITWSPEHVRGAENGAERAEN